MTGGRVVTHVNCTMGTAVRTSGACWLGGALRLVLVCGLLAMGSSCGLSKAHRDAVHLVNQGVRALEAGQSGTARRLFERALLAEPSNAAAHYHLGLVLLHDAHDPSAAVEHLKRATEARPDDPNALYQLGRALDALGKHDEAVRLYERVTALDPRHAGATWQLGQAALRRGDRRTAERLMRKAIALDPLQPAWYVALGTLYEDAGADETALAVYREGLRLNPEDVDLRVELASVLVRLGRAGEALELLVEAEQRATDRPDLFFAVGSAYLKVGNDKQAMRAFAAYLHATKDLPDARAPFRPVARVLLDNLRKEQALRTAKPQQ